jgi:DNA polymerase III delta subunit
MNKKKSIVDSVPRNAAVLAGDDTIGREKAKAEILAALYRRHPDATEEYIDVSSGRIEQLVERVLTPSMFGCMRIFRVGHTAQLSREGWDELSRVIRYDLPDVFLLVDFDEENATAPQAAAKLSALEGKGKKGIAAEHAAIFRFSRPREYKLPEWLSENVPLLFGRTMTKESARFLIECVGSDLDTIYSELQKIDIHLAPRAPVDARAIETICAGSREKTSFELARALGERDCARALDIVDSLFDSSVYAPMCISAVFRHFYAMLRIRAWAKANAAGLQQYLSGRLDYTAQNAGAHAIGVAAGLLGPADKEAKAYPVIVLSRIVQQAMSFTDARLREIIVWLHELDVNIKTGRDQGGREAFQLLCFKIAGTAPAAHPAGRL